MSPQINFLLAQALECLARSNLDGAKLYLNQAIRLQPQNPNALRLLGVIVAQQGQSNLALELINRALQFFPKNPLALSNLGNVFLSLKRFDEAIEAFDKSIKLDPKYTEAWSNKGNVYFELKEFEQALVCQEKAIQLKPDFADAWYNKGIIFNNLKFFNEAIFSYNQAIQIHPNHALAHLNKSLLMLLLGYYQEGWREYEWRWKTNFQKDSWREYEVPRWLGDQPLKNKTILIWQEQGLGDAIQFYRYIDSIVDLGAQVIWEAPQPLVKLFSSLKKNSCEVISHAASLPAFDFHCPLLSLPLAFQTNQDNIPKPGSYITLDNQQFGIRMWQGKLGQKTKPRVGLVWSGNPKHINDYNRSLSLSDLVSFLPKNFEYISLQTEVRDSDKLTLEHHPEIRRFEDSLNDFLDTAMLISQLDLIISVDTSVAHLGGALGKATWLLLPYVPDWRWLVDGADTPWYSSMKLYRQTAINNWGSVLDKVKEDLGSLNHNLKL